MTSQRFKLPWRAKKNAALSASSTLSGPLSAAESGDDLWYRAYQQVISEDPALVSTNARQYDRNSDQ
jgi:hypothetical protein